MSAIDYYAWLLLANKQLAVCDRVILSEKEFRSIIENAFKAGVESEKASASLFDNIFGKL